MNEDGVKRIVDKAFKKLEGCWLFKPVSSGMGVHGIPDYIGCYKGIFFAIETKKPGRRGQKNRGCSALQMIQINKISVAGGYAFVVDCRAEAEGVVEFLRSKTQ